MIIDELNVSIYMSHCLYYFRSLMNRVHNLLRFPHSPKLDKLPTPPHITSKLQKIQEVKDTKTSRAKARKGQGHKDTDTVESLPVITVN